MAGEAALDGNGTQLVDRAVERASGAEASGKAHPAPGRTGMRQISRILRRLAEPGAQMVVAEGMEKAIITRGEIRTAILAEIDRGVTVLHGEGGYTGEPSEVLLSVISNRELPRLEKLVHSIDPACFLIVSRVTEVSGRGFSMDKDYL